MMLQLHQARILLLTFTCHYGAGVGNVKPRSSSLANQYLPY